MLKVEIPRKADPEVLRRTEHVRNRAVALGVPADVAATIYWRRWRSMCAPGGWCFKLKGERSFRIASWGILFGRWRVEVDNRIWTDGHDEPAEAIAQCLMLLQERIPVPACQPGVH